MKFRSSSRTVIVCYKQHVDCTLADASLVGEYKSTLYGNLRNVQVSWDVTL